jgi:hypothetical protein
MLDTVDAALGRIVAEGDEIEVPEDATPLDFLRAVYRDSGQPMQRRMKAAVECLGYVHPKLAVTVSAIDGGSFAKMMEEISRP